MTPMGQRRDYKAIDVGNDPFHWFARFGRRLRELRLQIPGLDLGEYRENLNAFEVVCDPVDQFMTRAPKFLRIHIAQRGGNPFFSF